MKGSPMLWSVVLEAEGDREVGREEVVELAAVLLPTSADPKDLDAITQHLARHAHIESATWTVSAGP